MGFLKHGVGDTGVHLISLFLFSMFERFHENMLSVYSGRNVPGIIRCPFPSLFPHEILSGPQTPVLVSFALRCPAAQKTQVHAGKKPYLGYLLIGGSSENSVSSPPPNLRAEKQRQRKPAEHSPKPVASQRKKPLKHQDTGCDVRVLQMPGASSQKGPQAFTSLRVYGFSIYVNSNKVWVPIPKGTANEKEEGLLTATLQTNCQQEIKADVDGRRQKSYKKLP